MEIVKYLILFFVSLNYSANMNNLKIKDLSVNQLLQKIEQLPQDIQKYYITKFILDENLIYSPEFIELNIRISDKNIDYKYIISSDYKFIVVCPNKYITQVINLETGKILHTVNHNDYVNSIKISRDKGLEVVCKWYNKKVFNFQLGPPIHVIRYDNGSISASINDIRYTNKVLRNICNDYQAHILDLSIKKFKDLDLKQIKLICWLYTQKSQNIAIYKNADLKIRLNENQMLIFNSLSKIIQSSLDKIYNLKTENSYCAIM